MSRRPPIKCRPNRFWLAGVISEKVISYDSEHYRSVVTVTDATLVSARVYAYVYTVHAPERRTKEKTWCSAADCQALDKGPARPPVQGLL